MSIRLVNAALDDKDGEIILRGVIDPESLAGLRVADYQREVLPTATIRKLSKAIRERRNVPDIQLGMRGGSFTERAGAFLLNDEVFIIDGLQRATAAIQLVQEDFLPHLGATVYFNTTEASERESFRALNMDRVKLSPNVLLYNARHDNPVVSLLYQLTIESTFAMHDRVCWQQSMKRSHLIPATTLVRTTLSLHHKFAGTNENDAQVLNSASKLLRIKTGRAAIRSNVKLFWQSMEDMYNISKITYRELTPFLRSTYLVTLATVFASYADFWDDALFKLPTDLKKKIATFPLNDPGVQQLCSAGNTTAGRILAPMIVDHLNSGKRTRRLRPIVKEEVVA